MCGIPFKNAFWGNTFFICFLTKFPGGQKMTHYLNDKLCVDVERRIAVYCEEHKLDFNCVTAQKIVLEACIGKPIFKPFYNKETNEFRSRDITEDLAWEYSCNKVALERVQEKIKALTEIRQKEKFNAAIEADKEQAKPNLDKLVDSLYKLNIADGRSYLALVYFLMQVKYTRNCEMPKERKSQRVVLFLNGIPQSGKSTFAEALMEIEKKYRLVNFVNDADSFTERFQEALWRAGLNFCDEVIPSKILRSKLIRAIDGGSTQLEQKNKSPYTYNVNTNLMFASNEAISLKQRRVSVVKFGLKKDYSVPFGTVVGWVKDIMDSLPDFYWHEKMYRVVGNNNQNCLNPLGIASVSQYLKDRLGEVPPTEKKAIKFTLSQIYDKVLDKTAYSYITSERREAIKETINYLKTKKEFIQEYSSKGCTTKQFTIDAQHYHLFRDWADVINTADETFAKISKAGLRMLLAPYFEEKPEEYVPLSKIELPAVIPMPAPKELLLLPSPTYFSRTTVVKEVK